jgi:hypothetical protein
MVWVLGNCYGGPPFINIDQQDAAGLVQGPVSAMLLTGASSDEDNYVVLIGGGEASGSHIDALAESQAGVTMPWGLQQYLPTFTNNQATQPASPGYPASGNPPVPEGGAGATIATLGLWPADWTLNSEYNIDWTSSGVSGFCQDSDVANCLSALNPVASLSFAKSSLYGDVGHGGTAARNAKGAPDTFSASSNVWLVGYLTAAAAIGNGSVSYSWTGEGYLSNNAGVSNGVILNYCGSSYSGIQSVENGSYTFWMYEHMYYSRNNTDTNSNSNPQKETVDDIADALFLVFASTNSSGITDPSGTTVNVSGILYNNMNSGRGIEGSIPYANH